MKLLLLLPDGTGVRNFFYTDFIEQCAQAGLSVTAWSDPVILELLEGGRTDQVALPPKRPLSVWGELLRSAWQLGLLRFQAKRFQNPVYLTYIFPRVGNNFKALAKYVLVQLLSSIAGNHPRRLEMLRTLFLRDAKQSVYFKACVAQLKQIQPSVVFCTHQRASKAIAPMLAARALQIPTVCFIYSWDNLPKATLFVESDYYVVWSTHMKVEMLKYHPKVSADRVHVVGTPQFVPYFNTDLYQDRETFAQTYGLPEDHLWICYSGDDTTTSPNDPIYLQHLAEAVRQWNTADDRQALHIVFRRCPADHSNRFDVVLRHYADVITAVHPKWETIDASGAWHTIVPKSEDITLLVNTVRHCALVVNVGSTMAHDFSIMGKPCIYIHYNVDSNRDWDINAVYKFIHFETMEGLKPVFWVNQAHEWGLKLELALFHSTATVLDCKVWHARVALYPLEEAGNRFVQSLKRIVAR